jgi:hypothetical protein
MMPVPRTVVVYVNGIKQKRAVRYWEEGLPILELLPGEEMCRLPDGVIYIISPEVEEQGDEWVPRPRRPV